MSERAFQVPGISGCYILVEPGGLRVSEGLGCGLLLSPSHLYRPATELSGEQHPAPDLGGGLQETHPTPVPVQEGSLQPRELWHEARVTAVGWIPKNFARGEWTTLSRCVGTKPGVQRWVAHLPRAPYLPVCQTALAQSPLQVAINHPHRRSYAAKQAGKRGEQTPFLLFPVDINPHTHKPLATCIVIVIKLMP